MSTIGDRTFYLSPSATYEQQSIVCNLVCIDPVVSSSCFQHCMGEREESVAAFIDLVEGKQDKSLLPLKNNDNALAAGMHSSNQAQIVSATEVSIGVCATAIKTSAFQNIVSYLGLGAIFLAETKMSSHFFKKASHTSSYAKVAYLALGGLSIAIAGYVVIENGPEVLLAAGGIAIAEYGIRSIAKRIGRLFHHSTKQESPPLRKPKPRNTQAPLPPPKMARHFNIPSVHHPQIFEEMDASQKISRQKEILSTVCHICTKIIDRNAKKQVCRCGLIYCSKECQRSNWPHDCRGKGPAMV